MSREDFRGEQREPESDLCLGEDSPVLSAVLFESGPSESIGSLVIVLTVGVYGVAFLNREGCGLHWSLRVCGTS